jgi:hypothetical protein
VAELRSEVAAESAAKDDSLILQRINPEDTLKL